MDNNNFILLESFVSSKFIVLIYIKYFTTKNEIMKNSSYTFSHIHNCCKELESKKLIELKKVGRKNLISLNKSGELIHSYLLLINDILIKNMEENKNE
jgi:hypothetical protein